VAVAHYLAGLRAGIGEAEAVHYVIKAHLQHLQEVLTRKPWALLGCLEVTLELPLQYAVHTASFLLLAKLQAEVGYFAAATLSVRAGRLVAPLDAALGAETSLSLEEELHPLSTAELTNWSCISSHFFSNFEFLILNFELNSLT
jgi:hypothetical protein